jgi:hypothetical protein
MSLSDLGMVLIVVSLAAFVSAMFSAALGALEAADALLSVSFMFAMLAGLTALSVTVWWSA